jgi:hypothetical protein
VFLATFPALRGRLVALSAPFPSSGSQGPDDRVKGLKPSLTLYRKGPQGTEVLADNTAARAGDLVRVAYQAAGHAYGVIVSVDGRGGVTLHLPRSGPRAARLEPGDRVLLQAAYELDDAPRWEKFYLVAGDAPFDIEPIMAAAREAAAAAGDEGPPALVLPAGLEQASLSIAKEGRS